MGWDVCIHVCRERGIGGRSVDVGYEWDVGKGK